MTKLRLTLPAALCLFALVFGGRLWVVDRFGTDIPNWDQLDAEGLHLLLPYAQGRLTAEEWLHKHNEHRVVLTKALSLGLTVANGQWDNRLEAVTHAALYALLAIALWIVCGRWVAPPCRPALFLAVAAACGLPLAWHNMIEGFHSQQYLLLWTSLGAIWWLLAAPTGSLRWWGGGIFAIAANFTMGSGLAAAAAVSAVLVLRRLLGQVTWRQVWPTLAFCGVALAIGIVSRADAPQHAPLKAQSVSDFLLTVIHCFQWPVLESMLAAPIVQGPLLWAALWTLLSAKGRGPSGDALLACAGWLLLQVVATGYARGVGGGWPQPRYYDTLAIGVLAGAVALCWLPTVGANATAAGRRGFLALTVAWIAVTGFGLGKLTWQHVRRDLPPLIDEQNEWAHSTRGWIVTGDRSYLENHRIPYPDVNAMERTLSQPELRRLLPATVRAPLPVKAEFQPDPFGTGQVAPDTAALKHLLFWGSYQPRDSGRAFGPWLSAPFVSGSPMLVVEMAGQPDLEGLSLTAERVSDGRVVARFIPTRRPDLTWRAAYAQVPAGETLRLVARDTRADAWLAFSQPVEMGRLSYLAFRLSQQGGLLAVLGGIGATLLGLLVFARRYLVRGVARIPSHPTTAPAIGATRTLP